LTKVEFQSFIKSFLLFFISLSSILLGSMFFDYKNKINLFDNQILLEMRMCNYNSKYCDNFNVYFIKNGQSKSIYSLHKTNQDLVSYYPISDKFNDVMKIEMKKNIYIKIVNGIFEDYLTYLFLILGGIFFLSLSFSFYALRPLKEALTITNEFIKDFLHDFNTPISSLRLNISMLKRKNGESKEIIRSENAIENILRLQEHLKSYLNKTEMKKSIFSLNEILNENISVLEKTYHNVQIKNNIDKNIMINTNLDMFHRILLNLLTNACKYNVIDKPIVEIYFNNNILEIKNKSVGIKNIKKIFNRFYKEQERGIGIGLHIVDKLVKEINIEIKVESNKNEFTTFYLNLKNIIN